MSSGASRCSRLNSQRPTSPYSGYGTLRQQFALELQRARQTSGLSKAELEARIGCRHDGLSKLLTGRRLPSPVMFTNILGALRPTPSVRQRLIMLYLLNTNNPAVADTRKTVDT